MARKETPDFILTDVTMPVMDGLSMIHEIKQDTTLNNIPVMILSAKASVEDQQRGFDEGVDAYITKPFSTPYLLGRIEAILTQRRNIQMDVIRKLKETGDKDAIAALRILPAAAPLPALNQAETSAENEAVDPNSELAFMAAQVQAIYHFYSPRLLHRQSQPEIHPYSRTVMMLPGSRPVQHPGKMHSQHSQIINPNMLRSSNIVTGEKAITAILVTT